jgi:hypothetical protein
MASMTLSNAQYAGMYNSQWSQFVYADRYWGVLLMVLEWNVKAFND